MTRIVCALAGADGDCVVACSNERPFMKRVFTSSEVPELQIIQSMLQQAGLPCQLRSANVLDALGAEPFNAELWVERDADYPRARELFEAWSQPAAHLTKSWVCPKCQLKLAEVFDTCWKCGTHRLVAG